MTHHAASVFGRGVEGLGLRLPTADPGAGRGGGRIALTPTGVGWLARGRPEPRVHQTTRVWQHTRTGQANSSDGSGKRDVSDILAVRSLKSSRPRLGAVRCSHRHSVLACFDQDGAPRLRWPVPIDGMPRGLESGCDFGERRDRTEST